MRRIMNLTQHAPSPEQVAAGVVANDADLQAKVSKLLTFVDLPSKAEVQAAADALAQLVVENGFDQAMIGGAPFLMGSLEEALKRSGVRALYAFSKRESVETVQADGSVVKTAQFRHLGFVEA